MKYLDLSLKKIETNYSMNSKNLFSMPTKVKEVIDLNVISKSIQQSLIIYIRDIESMLNGS